MIALSLFLAAALATALFVAASARSRGRQLANDLLLTRDSLEVARSESRALLERHLRELAQLRDRQAAELAVQQDRRAAELACERDRHAQETAFARREKAAELEAQHQRQAAETEALHARNARELAVQRELMARQGEDLALLHRQLTAVESARSAIEAQLSASPDRQQLLDQAQKTLEDTIAIASKKALDSNAAHVVQLAEQVLARAHESSKADLDKRAEAVEQLVKPVQESLCRVDEKIALLEKSGEVSAARIAEQMRNVAAGEERLRGETARLATALQSPATRGRWGELQLRRTLELAGLRAHVDFHEQPVASLPDGILRPDVAVRLPGGRTVLLDSKVPLEAYLQLIKAPDAEREPLLRAHASQLRAHIESLARKQYWDAFAGSPEMAVLFLPSEGLLSAALEVDPTLHEDAFARRIVLATPATLLALLLTIAHVWKEESLAVNAREIANEGRELHKRLADLSRHLAKLGKTLKSVVDTYNCAVGSFDSRVVPAARRFEELRAASADVHLDPLLEVEVLPRIPRAAGEELAGDGAVRSEDAN
jgi:DNA recombination protein RmuC